MQTQQDPGDHAHARITLGPVEKLAVSGLATGFLGLCGWLVISVNSMLTQQQLTQQQLQTVNQQLQTINTQLADVPALKLELAKTQIKVEQHDQELKELKQLRGLK